MTPQGRLVGPNSGCSKGRSTEAERSEANRGREAPEEI